jgi:hypothetical protein
MGVNLKAFVKKAIFLLLLTQPAFSDPSVTPSPSSPPITQEQFRAWTDWAKKAVQNLDLREKKVEAEEAKLKANAAANPSPSQSEQAVDLSNLAASPPSETPGNPQYIPGSGALTPRFTAYFDLNFVNQPGTADSLAFDSYHNFLFFDIAPTPDLTFSFNLLGPQTIPLYYELDYQATPKLTLRAGKIWIPFDDLSWSDPHTIFGGRVGLQQLMPSTGGGNGSIFLPSVWTELGVGAKYVIVDKKNLQVETHACLLNGFTDGGIDPAGGAEYPQFNEYTPNTGTLNGGSGNHRAKSYDLRAHALLNNRFGLGVSYYHGQWNQDGDPNSGGAGLDLSMIGVDAQAQAFGLEFRLGVASMTVDLPPEQSPFSSKAKRGGDYIEVGRPFAKNKWKLLARVGKLQLDNRIILPTDGTIAGATILYNPGTIQFSIDYSRNITYPATTIDFSSYTDLRMLMMF